MAVPLMSTRWCCDTSVNVKSQHSSGLTRSVTFSCYYGNYNGEYVRLDDSLYFHSVFLSVCVRARGKHLICIVGVEASEGIYKIQS